MAVRGRMDLDLTCRVILGPTNMASPTVTPRTLPTMTDTAVHNMFCQLIAIDPVVVDKALPKVTFRRHEPVRNDYVIN